MDMARMYNKIGRFTVTEILIVVVLIAVLVYAMRPNYVHVSHSAKNACISSLRIIDGAKRAWALEHNKQNTDTPTDSDIQPYMGPLPSGELPACPNDSSQTFDTSYSINSVGTKPTCKIYPTNHILP